MDIFSISPLYLIVIAIGIVISVVRMSSVSKSISKSKKKANSVDSSGLSNPDVLKQSVDEDETLTALKKSLDQLVDNKLDLIPVYGYRMDRGVMATTIYNFVFGFNPTSEGFLLAPLNGDTTEIGGEPVFFDKSNVTSVASKLDGSIQIKSSLLEKGSIAVILPGFTTSENADTYMLVLEQTIPVMAFKQYLKHYYNL